MTITEFDANVEEIEIVNRDGETETIFEPIDSYNIHTFTFGSGGQTGTLINDDRFDSEEGIDRIPVETYPVPRSNLSLAIMDDAPANEDLNGDLLVQDIVIDGTPEPYADIRVYGFLGFYRRDFFSESSTRFCEYIRANNDDIVNRFLDNLGPTDYSRYGQDIGNGKLTISNGTNTFALVDANGFPVVENINTLNQNIGGLLPETYRTIANGIIREEVDIYTVRVQIGDIFFYIARNGKPYLFAVINIDERDTGNQLEPAVKKRLSIIFSEV
jgi:hypothetical protein